MRYYFSIFIFLFLFFGCKNEVNKSYIGTSLLESLGIQQEGLLQLDKLINTFQFDSALHLINQDQSLDTTTLEYQFLFTKLNYALKQFKPKLYRSTKPPLWSNLNERQYLISEVLNYMTFDFQNKEEFENRLEKFEANYPLETQILTHCYFVLAEYYQSIEFDEKKALKFSEEIVKISFKQNDFSWLYFEALENLVRLEIVNRDEYKANAYTQLFFKSLENAPENNLLKTKALTLEGLTLNFLEKNDEALTRFINAIDVLPQDPCLFDRQEVLKTILYFCNKIENWSLYEKYIEKLIREIENCGDYSNLNKIEGVQAIKKGNFNLAISKLQEAYQFVVSSKPIDNNQLGSIIYYLYSAYLSTKKYDDALNVYYSETLNPIPSKIEKWDKSRIFDGVKTESTFYFMTIGFYANVFFEKYKDYCNIDDLLYAKELLDSSKKLIQKEAKYINEDRILRIFQYAEMVFNLGREINLQLYEKFDEYKYLENFHLFSEASKSSLTYSLIENANSKGLKVQQAIDSLILADNNTDTFLKLKDDLSNLSIPYRSLDEKGLIQKIQKSLAFDQVLIDYNIINDRLFVHYIYADTTYIYDINYNDYRHYINELIVLQKDKNCKIENLQNCSKQAFRGLFPSTELPYNVVIIPDKHLADLSFDLLITQEEEYLIDSHLISYTGSGYQFITSKEKKKVDNSEVMAFFYSDTSSMLNAQYTMDELPGNVNEKDIIESTYPRAKCYSGKENNKALFLKSISEHQFDIIHVATHGYASVEDIKDIRLYFREPDYSLDSIYAYHILDKRIKANLVILSACQSGAGKYIQGEGKFDWNRYVLLAGAKSVISSLWEIEDKASKLIFTDFYNSRENSKSERIRAAKVALKNNPTYSHPYYWSGFIFSQ